MAAINDTIISISTTVAANLTGDKDTGSITAAADTYEKTLPQGLTMDIVNQVAEHNTNFVAGATHAFGQMAMGLMSENKKLDTVIGQMTMGGEDSLNLHYTRSKEMHVPGKDDKITKYGVTNITYEVKAGKNGGELKKVRTQLNELAFAAFGSK